MLAVYDWTAAVFHRLPEAVAIRLRPVLQARGDAFANRRLG